MKVVAMVPARMGSERLQMKNLALLDGKPLISYAIQAAKASGVFDRVVLNSDSAVFEQVAHQYDIDFYLRPTELGSSDTKSDTVVYDFMEHIPSDIVAWVNPYRSVAWNHLRQGSMGRHDRSSSWVPRLGYLFRRLVGDAAHSGFPRADHGLAGRSAPRPR